MSRRFVLCAMVAFFFASIPPARADVMITVNIATQHMEVVVDGHSMYRWPVATARPGYRTPTGTFSPYLLASWHRSKRYHNSPMPFSIFFFKGYAIHGSYDTVGVPASHGCVRLDPAHAATLFGIVEMHGNAVTTINIVPRRVQ